MTFSVPSKAISRQGVLLLSALMAAASYAQQPQPPVLQQNPAITLQAFEPAADQPYQLGRGDVINIEAVGRPELTGRQTIGPDGDISLPVIGSIKVADLTREEAATAIETSLASYYEHLKVSIGVIAYTSNRIIVLGAVEHPGIMQFDRTPTLLEVISRSGALPENSNSQGSGSAPGTRSTGIPEEVLIYRGGGTMVSVQLRALLESGSPLINMRLKRDDVIYVTGRTSYISLLGEVMHPGNQRLESTSTLADLIAAAGGPTVRAGHDPQINIIHRNIAAGPNRVQKIAFSDMTHSTALDVSLHSGDIIFIPSSGFNNVAYTIEKLAPLINLITLGTVLNNR